MIVYLHGFNSSSQSFKARALRAYLEKEGREDELLCPDLPPSPREAMDGITRLLDGLDGAPVALVGSSLGGYYATWLAERRGLRAALLNPAMRPYELLKDYVGPQKNLYTGAEYELTVQHLDELAALEAERITPERYLLLVETGDEVLDYRQAVDRYRGCRQIIVPGGDHGLSDFGRHVDAVLRFAREPAVRPV